MSQSASPKTNLSSVDNTEFAHLELAQAIETFRIQFNLLIQILTIFVISDVTVIGYAISSQISGIFFVGAFIPLMMLLVINGAEKYMMVVLYTAVVLESKYGKRNTDWLASTYISVVSSSKLIKRLYEISQIDDYEERIGTLRKQRLAIVRRTSFRFVLIVIAFAHVIVAFLLSSAFHWRLL